MTDAEVNVPPVAEDNKPQPTVWYKRRAVVIAGVVLGAAAVAAIIAGVFAGTGVLSSSSNSSSSTSNGSGPGETQTDAAAGTPAPATGYYYQYPATVEEKSYSPVYADLEKAHFTPWAEWKAKCGNGKCEEGEWCRTCPQDCPCTVNCGNGVCDDGENGDSCPQDCPYFLAACGNGKCEANDTLWTWQYENPINCPQDCTNKDVCGNGKCEASESCFLCPQDCGKCAPMCGDLRCDANEDCKSCPRDCGLCDIKVGDGICDWPRESLADSKDCRTEILTNNITFEGVTYATIDNAPVPSGLPFTDTSCTNQWIEVPAGWRIAVLNARASRLLKTGKVSFSTGCVVFADGYARPANLKDSKPGDCGEVPIQVSIVNGVTKYQLGKDMCPSRILVQSLRSSLENSKEGELKACPFNCSGHGACDPFEGVCVCNGRWTGPGCERVTGDLRIPESNNTWYKPVRGVAWQWQLQGNIDRSFNVPLYDIDFDNSPAIFDKLHQDGRKVMCYFSAGSWENFRTDQALFPREFLGGSLNFGTGDDFKDEAWIDLRRMDAYMGLMLDRIDQAKRRGCDGIEFDNPDGIIHSTNFKDKNSYILNTQIVYNKWLVAQSHARGLAVALKNSNEFASFLWETYDMVVNEECFINGNCANYWSFLKANKPVLNTEYFTARCLYCDAANKMNFSTIKKVPDLTACRADCKTTWNTAPCVAAKFPNPPVQGNWCAAVTNDLPDECPNKRFAPCDPKRPY
eukprot:comp19325_c0_seq1/m.22224 comp19325_c0_seq1/g.22224  ORF comp19325_c0_seq1/g.22224 comp19325_c0_seq1/m.22224 type:complete len:743 (-) comp19325_c0_seq1:434-2662(-)